MFTLSPVLPFDVEALRQSATQLIAAFKESNVISNYATMLSGHQQRLALTATYDTSAASSTPISMSGRSGIGSQVGMKHHRHLYCIPSPQFVGESIIRLNCQTATV